MSLRAKAWFAAVIAMTLAARATAQVPAIEETPPDPVRIWQGGPNSIWVVPCPDRTRYGSTVEARRNGVSIQGPECYPFREFIEIGWSRKPRLGGPDVLVVGHHGNDIGCADVMALVFTNRPNLNTVSFCMAEQVPIVLRGGLPTFDAILDVPFTTFGISRAVGKIPVTARRDGFVADIRRMISAPLSSAKLTRARAIMLTDIRRWAACHKQPDTACEELTPETVQVLLDFTLAGRADQARRVLFEAGSAAAGSAFQAESVWDDFGLATTSHPLWQRFQLDRLPHADLVQAASRKGHEPRQGHDYITDR